MPLPQLLMPADLPTFLVGGHGAEWDKPFGDVPMQTGHWRKRRKWTTSNQRVPVSLFLERAQMTSFHAWHRDSLLSGQRVFAARVKEQGFGMLWYTAFFTAMYDAEALHFGRWLVRAELLLSGDGEADTPTLAPFRAEVEIPFTGRGSPTVVKRLSAEVLIEFLSASTS